jgi:MipA family protein
MAGARITCLVVALALGAHVGFAHAADDECKAPTDDCVQVGGWNFSVALGAGDRTNPLVHSQDIPLVVIPQFSYYGKRVFVDDLDLGVTLLDGDSSQLNLVASPGYDRVFFYRSDLQNFLVGNVGALAGSFPAGNNQHAQTAQDLREQQQVIESRPRHITYLAGPEWTFKLFGISGQLDYLHEITAQDHGDEIRGALGIPLGHAFGSWSSNIGFTWKSAAIINYYYGAPGVYEAGPGLDPFIKISYTRPLSRKWKLTAFMDYERLSSSIANSPIVARHSVTTGFIGALYEFHK